MDFEFSAPLDFSRTLAYISRYEIAQSPDTGSGTLRQVLADSAGYFLVEIRPLGPRRVTAVQLTGRSSARRETLIRKYVARTFGSDRDLLAFYRFAKRDPILAGLVRRFRGARVVGIADLWECLVWSIIGQQISVAAAFSVRSRLARRAGAVVKWRGSEYEGFPRTTDVLKLGAGALHTCSLTRQKSQYVLGIAEAMLAGELDEAKITALPFDEARQQLLHLRGIGPWSAEYAMMRVMLDPDACPREDIGLRNALGEVFRLGRQAGVEETKHFTAKWKPFRGHATFYLWQTLL